MQELLTSEEFPAYLELQIEAGVEILIKLEQGHITPEYFNGAMDMLKKILRVPEDNAKGEANIKFAKELSEKSFNLFERKMIKRILHES